MHMVLMHKVLMHKILLILFDPMEYDGRGLAVGDVGA